MRVLYTDPAWALDGNGAPDLSRATIERAIYGDEIELEIGPFEGGRFVTDGAALHERVAAADAIVVYRCDVTPELLSAAGPPCRVVARQGVGLDNLNVELLRERGIYGFHVPDYCTDEVSTHAVGLLLALERGICAQNAEVKANRWSIYGGGVPRRTSARTVGIVGYGRIGRAASRKLQPLYGSVLAFDPYVSSDLMAGYGVRSCGDLHELLAASDAVLLHAASAPETDGMIDERAVAAAKPGCLLVNTARGRLVKPAAVLEGLRSGRLGGFASDVFSPEDPNDTPATRALLARDDVIVTAHRAFLSEESERSLRQRVAEGVAHVLRSGAPPPLGRVA